MKDENYLGFKVPAGKVTRIKAFGDEQLEHAFLENRFTRRFTGYRLIKKDLELIKEAIYEFQKLSASSADIIRQSLTFFIIITYGKCFSTADDRGVRVDKSALNQCADQDKALHEEILNLRNQYVAHGGRSDFESNSVVMVKVPFDGYHGFRTHDNGVFMFSFKPELKPFNSLIDVLLVYVEQKIDKAYTSMMQDISDNLDWDVFSKYSFKPQ